MSTVSILAEAQEENIDILLISKDNLDTELEKLNTDEATKQNVINAVNSGKVVTIPAEDVTMGDWHGTGYIVTNPETGVGAYMISGGLNGGSVMIPASITFLAGVFYTVIELSGLLSVLVGVAELLVGGALFLPLVLFTLTCIAMCVVVERYIRWQCAYMAFLLEGNFDAAYQMMYEFANNVETDAKITVVFSTLSVLLKYVAWKYGIDIVSAINKILRKYTSQKIQNIISKHGITVEEFSELLQYDRQLSKEEKELVDIVRNEIGEIPKDGTIMAKIIPQADIESYLKGDYPFVRGFVSEAEFSENLKTLDEVFEGNRLDYANTAFSLSDDTYGKITYLHDAETQIAVPRYPPAIDDYPYTGKGFTASKNIILPEWEIEKHIFRNNDILEIIDAKTGHVMETYIYDIEEGWIKSGGKK